MRRAIFGLLAAAFAGHPAAAQILAPAPPPAERPDSRAAERVEVEGRGFASSEGVRVWRDPATGAVRASSLAMTEQQDNNARVQRREVVVRFNVEAYKLGEVPAVVVIVGQRLSFERIEDVPRQREFGYSDPAEPALVGSPWRELDLKSPWLKFFCDPGERRCERIQAYEIVLPGALVRELIARGASSDIPISLSPDRRADWRMPKRELVETLEALGVIGEFR